ncbi:deoxyribonuclease IV [Fundicoccus ignavus]|uniref:Probable endonuclease 4 n=1 Tax=Fundicoccus ignavus TaxID=2664442 RepID=A0A6I2GK05_9LACT|nr:deoxyribonuclease IV [Fundicoccus ignavus]MRI84918.1 deoxyribonuclease IV [Fundicoccus ignavus]MRJ46439.1 deoxyribonuclease IV [Fundicoccus ignavus]
MIKLFLGSHVSMSGKEMLLGSAQEAASYGANIFMIYTGAPQNTRRKEVSAFRLEEASVFMQENGIEFLTVHAPYIINLGNTTKEGYFEFATEFLAKEIERVEYLGAKQMTMHPGAHVGAGVDVGLAQIIRGLNEVITPHQHSQIALETMAGKGTELGRTFEELAIIIDGVTHNEKLSVTLDTCHIYDAGYDIVNDLDGVLNEFDKVIGLERLKVLHINDSKNPIKSHKDRHANIGQGSIGFETLDKIVHHPQLISVPKILETPWVEVGEKKKVAPYKHEINMLRKRTFNQNLMLDIIENN